MTTGASEAASSARRISGGRTTSDLHLLLLRKLRPASYQMEMNPLTANRKGSGLADDIRGADSLILTSVWDDWNEPDDSSKYRPSEPNGVVRKAFCLRFESGDRLYERCDRGA